MGNLVVTHVYLLLGCAAPLWLSWLPRLADRGGRASPLTAYAGVIALGVGDAAVRACVHLCCPT
jgi:hypothetical protein